MSAVQTGRNRQTIALEFLSLYAAATTSQLAALLWGGDQRLASRHLLRLTDDGLLRRVPHPVYRKGPWVYSRTDRQTAHSQKVLHHLAAVDLHIAISRNLGRYGARTVPELPWGSNLIPDQTVFWKDRAWAVEHHLSGRFQHAPDYRRWFEEENWEGRSWWRPGMWIGLLVITSPRFTEHVRYQLRLHELAGIVAVTESVLQDPGRYLK